MTDLGALTSPEVGAMEEATLVVPVGSCEQHGPHLPLDTDTRIAVALARRAADGLDGVVVGPALAYGASGEHEGFPGTVSAGTTATARFLLELVRSAIPPFKRVVVVNGHGGNADALGWVAQRCRDEGRPFAWWTATAAQGADVAFADLHAGGFETSLLLAIDPMAVRLDLLAPGARLDPGDAVALLRDGGVASVAPSGVLGDPTTSSMEEGRAALDRLVAELRALLSSP